MHRTARLAAYLAAAAVVALVPVAAHAATTDAPQAARTRTLTNHTPAAAVDAYWTPERIAAATPMPTPRTTGPRTAAAGPDGAGHLVPAALPDGAAAPVAADPAATATTLAASEWVTVGRLFFKVPNKGDYVCSANVVASNNHDVVATARHCVMDIATGQTYDSFRFAPAYDKGSAPYGWWNWRSMGWRVDDTSPGGDNAFIVMATGGTANRHIQDAVGGSGIGFNLPTNNYAHAIGLPASIDYAVWCEGQPYDGPAGGVQIPSCNGLSGGASGGAFIVNYNPSDGSAVQTATFFGTWGSDSYFAYFRDVAWQVYNGAQNA